MLQEAGQSYRKERGRTASACRPGSAWVHSASTLLPSKARCRSTWFAASLLFLLGMQKLDTSHRNNVVRQFVSTVEPSPRVPWTFCIWSTR